jgi:uncharacterized protein (TIGR03790 family)
MTVWRAFGTLLIVAGLSTAADTVLIVANANSSLSRNIAEYYARKRSIPQNNICYLRLTTEESIDRATYEKEVEAPVAACLQQRSLTEKILYIVTTSDVPLRVRGRVAMDGDNASVDSELTLLYSKMHGRRHTLNGIVPNPFYRRKDAPFQHKAFPIYLVTRLAAYDLNGVKALIDRSLAARNRGMFVLDAKADDNTQGNAWLKDAAIALPKDRTAFDDSAKVIGQVKDVIGFASWGSNDPARKTRTLGFRWLPGAIMSEYVSTNARTFKRPPASWQIGTWTDQKTYFAGAPQTLIGDYIEEGVTGVAGHVDEPYLAMTPHPDQLLPAWYSGRNLAESFYVSMPALSWQNIVIGDPLCSLGPPNR